MSQQHHYFYNPYHLGDHLFSFSFFRYWLSYDHNVIIHYSFPSAFHKDIHEYIYMSKTPQDRLLIEDYPLANQSTYTLFWINSPVISYKHTQHRHNTPFNLFLQKHFHYWIDFLNISIPKSFPLYLHPIEHVYPSIDYLPSIYHNVDILIINSYGMSGQYTMQPSEWDRMARGLHAMSGLKVCTTRKIPGILSTHDHCLSLYQIGLLSTKMKYMIGLNTSLLVASLHDQLPNIKGVYLFGQDTSFTFSNVYRCSSFLDIKDLNVIPQCIHYFYQCYLERFADNGGLNHYMKQYRSGSQTLKEIEHDIANSREAIEQYVEYQYNIAHHRPADEDGKQTYTNTLHSRNQSRQMVWKSHWQCQERLDRIPNDEQYKDLFQSIEPNSGTSIPLFSQSIDLLNN